MSEIAFLLTTNAFLDLLVKSSMSKCARFFAVEDLQKRYKNGRVKGNEKIGGTEKSAKCLKILLC